MNVRRATVHLSAAGLVAAACGPVVGGAVLPAPINACPDHPCSLYQPLQTGGPSAFCTGGICEVTSAVDYTLVVTLPDTSYFAPGQTFVIPSSQLFAQPPSMNCPIGHCAHLPTVGVENGQYRPEAAIQQDPDVRYWVGQVAALPVRVLYRPLLAPPDPMQPPPTAEAFGVGMPLLASLADVASPVDGVPGPGGGPNPGFRAVLPPGTYERTIIPESPYDEHFPPEVLSVTVASGVQSLQAGSATVVLDTIPTKPATRPKFNLLRADGARLDGWTTYLRDQSSLRRLSTVATLGPANLTNVLPATYQVTLNTNHHPPSNDAVKGTDLLLVPPPGNDAAPTLVAPYLAGALVVPASGYPLIPTPATVKGSVTAAAGSTPQSATLLFRSKKIYLTTADPSFTTNLAYETRTVATAAGAGADIRYSVRLPRGEYDVIAIPSDGGAAKSIQPLIVTVDVDTQDGKNILLADKRGVRGVARVSDGRALAGAQVVASPSSSLAASGVPSEIWPRLASATTEIDGSFVLRLDPGTYDLAVRPAEGSQLPWVVSPSRVILAGDSDLVLTDVIEIPAPIEKGLLLVDPQENPIARAMVRAFAVPSGGSAYVEIGRALTDATGHYALFLAGTPHP